MSEGQFKQLLEEQIQHKRSEEFDDIGHVLDQPDEEIMKDTSWRILELVYKAENKKAKRKRQSADKDSDRKPKKRKNIESNSTLDSREDRHMRSEDCNLGITLEMNSPSTTHNDGVPPHLNDTIISEQNESKNKAHKLPRTDLDTNADRAKDMSKTSKQDLTKPGVGTHDVENAENDTMSDDERENSDIDDEDDQNSNINDDENEGDEDDYDSDHDDDNDDDDEDGYETPDDDDDNGDDQEESEQPVTYGN